MKQNKILSALGLASSAQYNTISQFTKRIVQVTAFTVSCLVVLPSFVQTADAQTVLDPIDVWGEPIDDPWADWNGWGDEGWGCQSIACDDSDEGNGGGSPIDPDSCPPFEDIMNDSLVCWASVTAGTAGILAALQTASCSTCIVTLNPVACGGCLVLTGLAAVAFDQALNTCQPPDEYQHCL
jgi:hypothetical protein